MASTLPLKVAALIPEPLFLETPFRNYPDDVAASNAAQSSGAGDVYWSSVTFEHVQVNARHLEAPEAESRPRDLDVQEYDLTTVEFAKHYWPVRGFWVSATNETSWRKCVAGQFCMFMFNNVARLQDGAMREEVPSSASASTAVSDFTPKRVRSKRLVDEPQHECGGETSDQPMGCTTSGDVGTRQFPRPATKLAHPEERQTSNCPESLLTMFRDERVKPDAEFQNHMKGFGPATYFAIEMKSWRTIGLLRGCVFDPAESPAQRTERQRQHITDQLQLWASACADDCISGAMKQLLNHMLVKGAPAGLLMDAKWYVFVRLRRRSSLTGEARYPSSPPSPASAEHSQCTHGPWECEFYVAHCCDSWKANDKPSVLECLHVFSQYGLDAPVDWANLRAKLIARVSSKQGDVPGAGQRGSSASEPYALSGSGPTWKTWDDNMPIEETGIGFLIARNDQHSVWQYRSAVAGERHVLKTALLDDAREALVREVEVYNAAIRLQGDVLPTLHRAGTFHTRAGEVAILELTELESKDAVDLCKTPNAQDAVTEAFRRLWNEGVLHGDVAKRNIIVRPDGKGGFCVNLFDFGRSHVFDGPVPEEYHYVDSDKFDELFQSQ